MKFYCFCARSLAFRSFNDVDYSLWRGRPSSSLLKSSVESLEAWECRENNEDFSVREISLEGNVAATVGRRASLWASGRKPVVITPEEQRASVQALLSRRADVPDFLHQALSFATEASNSEPSSLGAQTLGPTQRPLFIPVDRIFDKEARSDFHKSLRDVAGLLVDSKTEKTADGSTLLKVWRKDPDAQRSQGRWDPSMPDYVRFVLSKRGVTTLDALGELSRRLDCKVERFAYAGAKDKVAATSQFVTLWRPPPLAAEILSSSSSSSSSFDQHSPKSGVTFRRGGVVSVGLFETADSPLRLGGLAGNRFRITLRGLKGLDLEQVADGLEGRPEKKKKKGEALDGRRAEQCAGGDSPTQVVNGIARVREGAARVAAKGFLNRFGTQRFGVSGQNSRVGAAMLRGDFDLALAIILHRALWIQNHASGITSSSSSSSSNQGDYDGAGVGSPLNPSFLAPFLSGNSRNDSSSCGSSSSSSSSSTSWSSLAEDQVGKGGVRDRLDQLLDNATAAAAATAAADSDVVRVGGENAPAATGGADQRSVRVGKERQSRKRKRRRGGTGSSKSDVSRQFQHLTSSERKLLQVLANQRRRFLAQEAQPNSSCSNNREEEPRSSPRPPPAGGRQPCYSSERALADALPRSLRRLFVEAWQSEVWNAVAAQRVHFTHTHSRTNFAIEGDLVLLKSKPNNEDDDGDESDGEKMTVECREVPKQDSGARRVAAALSAWEAPFAPKKHEEEGLHEVTREEAERGDFTLDQVCLPLLGSTVRLPSWLTPALLEAHCVQPGDVDLVSSVLEKGGGGGGGGGVRAELKLRGSYRFVVAVPRHVSVSTAHERDDDDDDGDEGSLLSAQSSSADDDGGDDGDDVSAVEAQQSLTYVRFDLPPSSYATECIRSIVAG